MDAARFSIATTVFGLVLFCAGYVHQKEFNTATPASRLDFLHALVQEKTVCINTYQNNTADKAVFEGSYYSDKAPGTILVALVPFALSAVFLSIGGVRLDSRFGWLCSSWVGCIGANGTVAAVGAAALWCWLSWRISARASLITTLAVFLGAAPLPYATMLFSHSMVVGLISIAMWAIRVGQDASVTGPKHQTLLAALGGGCCGLALASEYTAGLIVMCLFTWLVTSRRRCLIPFCAAAIPALLLIPAYSYACFRNPFILPYSLNESFPAMKEGLYAIKWPDAMTAFNLLFSPTRGLLFWTPFLLMAGYGYCKLLQRQRRFFWFMYLAPVMQIIVVSGRVWDWPAGPTLGPRYLAPILPLMALPCALGVQRFTKIGFALAAYSILITTLATLTDACPPASIYNPLTELHIPLFLKGQFSPNLGMVLGLPPYASVALYYAILIGGIAWLWHKLPKDETLGSPVGVGDDAAK